MGKLRRKMTDVTVMLGPRIWRQKSLGDIWERVWTSAVGALNSSPGGQIQGTKDQPNLEGREEELFFVGNQFSSVQFSSVIQSCLTVTPWTAAHQASLSITNSQSLLKFTSIKSVIPSNHLILCHPLLLLPSIFPGIRVFSNESILHIRWPKYWSFSFSPSNEYSGLISFKIGWLDLLADQGTLKHLLQYHSSKASILRCSAFFIVQLSQFVNWLYPNTK